MFFPSVLNNQLSKIEPERKLYTTLEIFKEIAYLPGVWIAGTLFFFWSPCYIYLLLKSKAWKTLIILVWFVIMFYILCLPKHKELKFTVMISNHKFQILEGSAYVFMWFNYPPRFNKNRKKMNKVKRETIST